MSSPVYLDSPVLCSEAFASIGLVCILASATTIGIADASGQGTVAALDAVGVNQSVTNAASERIAVVKRGPARGLAGAQITQGQLVVAQAGTGKQIPFAIADYTDGDKVVIIGQAQSAASGDGVPYELDVNITVLTISKPA